MKFVLDTNIALDWLVFSDPSTARLRKAIDASDVRILVNELIIDELRRVVTYPQFRLSNETQSEILNLYQSHAEQIEMPNGFSRTNLLLPDSFPRCRDSDDDHFVAMAYHSKADALLTKDKALLKLRKSARRFGVHIAPLRGVIIPGATA